MVGLGHGRCGANVAKDIQTQIWGVGVPLVTAYELRVGGASTKRHRTQDALSPDTPWL